MTIKSKTAIALALAVATGYAASAGAAEEKASVTCHGKTATYVGTDGDDHVTNEAGVDGKDIIEGSDPVVVLAGGDDAVRVTAHEGAFDSFTLCAGDGDDEIRVGEYDGPSSKGHPPILLDGGLGEDRVGSGYRPKDPVPLPPMVLIGGNDDDYLFGGGLPDKITAGRGDDYVSSSAGNDVISGGTGSDYLRGDEGSDRMNGGQGDDELAGERDVSGHEDEGKDFADGGQGNDRCEAERTKNCES